jgi:hypothetical protein
MDTKTIIETANAKLVDATNVCTGVNDTLETFVDALRDVLDNATAIRSQLAAWSVDDYVLLPVALREAGFDGDAVVSLTEIYYQNKIVNAKTPSAISTALDTSAQALVQFLQSGGLTELVGQLTAAFQPAAASAQSIPFDYFIKMLESYASEGDEVAMELLRLYRVSVADSGAAVKQDGDEVKENA